MLNRPRWWLRPSLNNVGEQIGEREGSAQSGLNATSSPRPPLPLTFCASSLGALHALNLSVWCVVRSLIIALTVYSVKERLLHARHLLEWHGNRFARMDVATVLQNGACATKMMTVVGWPLMPNQTRDSGATFAPNGNVFSTNDIFSNGSVMRSLRFHARGSTDAGQRLG